MQWRPGLVIGKYPTAETYYEFDLGAELTALSDTISTHEVTADTGLTVSDESLITGSDSGVANAGVRFKVSGGSADTQYDVTLTAVTATLAETIVRRVTFDCGEPSGKIIVESCS